jgi:hypothetical protein
MRFRRAAVVALALAVVAPAGCSDDGPGEGEARLEVDGRAVVERDGSEEAEVVDDSTTLRRGDRVEVTDGVATMAMRGGTRLELRAGLGDAAASRVEMASRPVLEAGDLLVAASDEPAEVEAAGTVVAVTDGAAQVSRSLGMGVTAYDGAVRLDSAGQERPVAALREVRVPTLGGPRAPRPLVYDETDPWDRRFLGAAIEVGDRLEALATGYTQNLNAGEGRTPGFFRIVLPGLEDEPEFGAELIDLERPPGETLIGAAITELGRRGDFAERWASVFEFRDAGAHWGLVALDQAVSGDPLLGEIEQAIGASPLALGGPPQPGPDTTAPPSTSPTTVPPTTGTTTPPSTTPPSTTPPSTAPPPTTPPLPDPLTPVLEPQVEPLTDVVDGLVSGLLGLLSPPPGG